MEEIILEAIERAKQPGKFKETGFVAGVLYGDSVAVAAPVKFDEAALRKVLSVHGANAKVWIKFNNSKKFGFIKEVQRNPITRNVSHVDVQIVSKDHEIKLQIPINYTGEEELRARQLQLQVYKPEITVFGKMALMPESITVDVSDMQLGDAITLKNFALDKDLKNESEDEVFGMIGHLKVVVEEVAEAVEPIAVEPKTE